MTAALWIAVGFLVGSLPCSVWIGYLALGRDIRFYGDGNPGGTNVIRAGSPFWGICAILMDYLKGAIPVGLAHYFAGVTGWLLVAAALAPVLGHAYSPFLSFRGGKAVAVTFGAWTGLTLWVGPVIMGVSLGLGFAVLTIEAWVVCLSMATLLAYLMLFSPQPVLLGAWFGNMVLLAWRHRAGLAHRPGLRSWIKQVMP